MREAFEELSVAALKHLHPGPVIVEWPRLSAEQLAAVNLFGWNQTMWQNWIADHNKGSPKLCVVLVL